MATLVGGGVSLVYATHAIEAADQLLRERMADKRIVRINRSSGGFGRRVGTIKVVERFHHRTGFIAGK